MCQLPCVQSFIPYFQPSIFIPSSMITVTIEYNNTSFKSIHLTYNFGFRLDINNFYFCFCIILYVIPYGSFQRILYCIAIFEGANY